MKNKIKEIIVLFLLITLGCLEILKYNIFDINNNFLEFILRNVIILLIFVINCFKLKKYNFVYNFILVFLVILGLLSTLFTSFNCLGCISLFIFLISLTFVFGCIFNHKFEISLVAVTTILILLMVLLGLLEILEYSYIFIALICILLILYSFKNKEKLINYISKIEKKSIIIFSILFLIAILGSLGRYIHKWDEYSYWGFAAKSMIDTESLSSMVSYVSGMNNYPPVSSVWHYFINLFLGYSEPNLYFGLMLLDFIFLIPIFIKLGKNDKFLLPLVLMTAVCFPLLFDGSIKYSLLYVDLLLGFMCTSVMVLNDYLEEENRTKKIIYLILIIITLLKPNGFVFSSCLLFLIFMKKVVSGKSYSIKKLLKILKKFIMPLFAIMFLFVSWQLISNLIIDEDLGYFYKLIPQSLSSDISQKLNSEFLIGYFNGLITSVDDTIIYSFINIPLFTLIVIVILIIYEVDKKEKKYNLLESSLPYVIFYITFYALTALSLFVVFSYYEATKLASFSRYLAPINIALVEFCIYKVSYLFKKEKLLYIVLIFILLLVGFSNLTFFVTDLKERVETKNISNSRMNDFLIVNKNTPADARVFVINQEDKDSIMPIWYARFYCYPRVINANSNAITWKVLTKSNSWDLEGWGLDEKTFMSHLIKYDFDYVYLYTSTIELYEKLKSYYWGEEEIEKFKLFRVNDIGEGPKLIPIE